MTEHAKPPMPERPRRPRHEEPEPAARALVAAIRAAAETGADLPDGCTMRLLMSAGDIRHLFAAMLADPLWRSIATETPPAEPRPGGDPYLYGMLAHRSALVAIRDYARLAAGDTEGAARVFLVEIEHMASTNLMENG